MQGQIRFGNAELISKRMSLEWMGSKQKTEEIVKLHSHTSNSSTHSCTLMVAGCENAIAQTQENARLLVCAHTRHVSEVGLDGKMKKTVCSTYR